MFFDLYSVTQSVPNGFSMADLEAMLEDAPTDVTDVCPDCGEENKLTDREKLLVERAEQVLPGSLLALHRCFRAGFSHEF